jgi:hypothetical protein
VAPRKKSNPYIAEIGRAKENIARHLIHLVESLKLLADGGIEQIQEEWIPAGLVLIDDTAPLGTSQRRPMKVLAFPDLPPDELVLVSRKRSVTLPDRASIIYLIDRVAGRPDVTISDGSGVEDQMPKTTTLDQLHDAYKDETLSA